MTAESNNPPARNTGSTKGSAAESRPFAVSVGTIVAHKMLSVPNRKSHRCERTAESCPSVVGLDNGVHRYLAPHAAGMQERTDVARVLRANPDVVLMDDPPERAVESEALRRFDSTEAAVRHGDQRA